MTADRQREAGEAPPAVVDLRAALGAVEVARDAVRVAGPEAVDYLQGQLSQDVAGLPTGESALSFVLQPTGKVDAWVRVTRAADDELVIDVDGGHGDALAARIRRFLLRTKADVDTLDWRALALRGPGAEQAAAGATAALRVPALWPGVEAVDLLGPRPEAPDVPAATAEAYRSLRIRCGVPAMGAELTAATIPAETARWVVAASVSFTKGCYTGQELVARIDSRGGNVPRPMRGVVMAAPGGGDGAPGPVDRLPAAGDAAVVVAGKTVGTLTSVAPRPGGGAVGLAVVARAVTPPADAEVVAGGDRVPARVVELPIDG